MGIIGKSGAGKSTLLNMISGVSEITSGEVSLTVVKTGPAARIKRVYQSIQWTKMKWRCGADATWELFTSHLN